ncbi:hypothetical protein GCM10010218_59750 [Streptomyces mashuensis]|uniref:Uncharacterized protein n=1 Tax=Streptomyces mashuensis TaxID=33904 RepID=A0A919EGB6_9ACTN|nr:hypothetical protein GCM10010218_59750 [Streptomyces mashuensis]
MGLAEAVQPGVGDEQRVESAAAVVQAGDAGVGVAADEHRLQSRVVLAQLGDATRGAGPHPGASRQLRESTRRSAGG